MIARRRCLTLEISDWHKRFLSTVRTYQLTAFLTKVKTVVLTFNCDCEIYSDDTKRMNFHTKDGWLAKFVQVVRTESETYELLLTSGSC